MNQMTVLVSLYRGYGLGDAVQMSAVLRHLRKHRPHWKIDFQAEEGRECVGRGIAHNCFRYGQNFPSDYYDAEVQMILYDIYSAYWDKPNTRVVSCLRDRFGLEWDRECSRYQINVSDLALAEVGAVMCSKSVALHYQGDTVPEKKNLSHDQAQRVCGNIISLGYTPLLLDWRDKMPIRHNLNISSMGGWPQSLEWGRSAEYNCAAISLCDAFVGIDSGPSKCASATDTPSLIVWTKHHPALYHDPAPNTTHLVPEDYRWLPPVSGNRAVMEWFEANYKVIRYVGDPVPSIHQWLYETLQ